MEEQLVAIGNTPELVAKFTEATTPDYVWHDKTTHAGRERVLHANLLSGAAGGFGMVLDQLDVLFGASDFRAALKLGERVVEVATSYYTSAAHLVWLKQSEPGFSVEALPEAEALEMHQLAQRMESLFGALTVGCLITGRSLRELGRLGEAKKIFQEGIQRVEAQPEALRNKYEGELRSLRTALEITLERQA